MAGVPDRPVDGRVRHPRNPLPATSQGGGSGHFRPRVLLGAEFIARMQDARLVRTDITPGLLGHVMGIMSTGLLMAEPVLHADDSPPLADTMDIMTMFLVNAVETDAGGDLSAGKRAFGELCQQLDAATAVVPGGSPAGTRTPVRPR